MATAQLGISSMFWPEPQSHFGLVLSCESAGGEWAASDTGGAGCDQTLLLLLQNVFVHIPKCISLFNPNILHVVPTHDQN